MEVRKRNVYSNRNPYTTPFKEFVEICQKIKELEKINAIHRA